jgi:hypothetical protein
MDGEEAECVKKCADKILKLNKRVGYRFAEINFSSAGQPGK